MNYATPSNSKLPWTEEGLYLLQNIQCYIEREGGEDVLFDKALYELEANKYKADEAYLFSNIKKMYHKMHRNEISSILGVTTTKVESVIRSIRKSA